MDNKLFFNDKNKDDRPEESKNPSPAAAGAALPENSPQPLDFSQPIGAYNPELTSKAWEASRQPWNATPEGRLAIRTFSRGVLGAAFFTAGGLLTRKWMHVDNVRYDPQKSLLGQGNPLQFIAKLIDTVAGKPIQAVVTAVAGEEAGLRAVRFRPTKFKGVHAPGASVQVRGRSLGAESVGITFDFFCASLGDAWGRDIAGWFDPGVKKKWLKETRDDNGKVHRRIEFPEAVKSAVKSLTRYITYNGGEDWAVAIPYVYFMKAHRNLLNKFSPGFSYDFDRSLNGGSFKVDPHGEIVGNFNKEGVIDLQHRFVVYNMGTLMFREAYDYIGRKLRGQQATLYGARDKPEEKGFGSHAASLVKWMARSVVKAGIYMTPAVPFFWITRTPQSKHRGLFINPQTGEALCYENPKVKAEVEAGRQKDRKYETLYANDLSQSVYRNPSTGLSVDTELYFSRYNPAWSDRPHAKQFAYIDGAYLPGRQYNPLVKNGEFNPYGKTFGAVDGILNAAGHANYKAAHMFDRPAKWADNNFGWAGNKAKTALRIDSFTRFTHPMVYAAASYTPYMYMKAELANIWDDGKMDVAAERLVDGAAKLNWGEFKSGAGEVWRAILHKPFADPTREAEAERRKLLDTSQADNALTAKPQPEPVAAKAASDWRSRIISGEKPDIGADKPKSHSDREEMRKLLEQLHPPTNSIN